MDANYIAILGGLITFLLSVNAYFFKDIVKSLNDIKIELAKMTAEHNANILLLQKHDDLIYNIRERLHKLEGFVPGIVKALKDFEEFDK